MGPVEARVPQHHGHHGHVTRVEAPRQTWAVAVGRVVEVRVVEPQHGPIRAEAQVEVEG